MAYNSILHEQFINEMKEMHPTIEVLNTYVNNDSLIECRCKKDGYIWTTTRRQLINKGHGCPLCGGSRKLNQEIFVKQMNFINPDIEIIGSYINLDTKIACHCKVCGNDWSATPYHLKAGEGCPVCRKKECSQNLALGMEEFKRRMKEIDDTIEISGEYINNRTHIHCHCKVCDHEWTAMPTNLLAGKGCPVCLSSKGEKAIYKWLKENSFNFESEYRFDNCRYKKPLPFDFYIPDLKIAIEFDGIQHEMPTNFGGKMSEEKAKKNFEVIKKRDAIKNKYCTDNNIQLIRISHKDFNNIPSILEKELKQ